MHSIPFLLAHQYGWDEALLFLLPIVIVLVGVRWVERRNRLPPDGPPPGDAPPGDDTPDGDTGP